MEKNKLIQTIADCLEQLDGEDYEGVAEALIDYLVERGYVIEDKSAPSVHT